MSNDNASLKKVSHFTQSPREVFEFCLEGKNFQAIFPDPITPVDSTKKPEDFIIKPNEEFSFRHWVWGFIPMRWDVRIVEYSENEEENRYHYADQLVKGPLTFWRHRHICEPDGNGGTRYTDDLEFSFGYKIIDDYILKGQVQKIFDHRHLKMAELLGEKEKKVSKEEKSSTVSNDQVKSISDNKPSNTPSVNSASSINKSTTLRSKL
ncbi:MAG: hypothetical protein V4612_03755 [Pseudomonadota bacterium]